MEDNLKKMKMEDNLKKRQHKKKRKKIEEFFYTGRRPTFF
jgi:hypothetical protein